MMRMVLIAAPSELVSIGSTSMETAPKRLPKSASVKIRSPTTQTW